MFKRRFVKTVALLLFTAPVAAFAFSGCKHSCRSPENRAAWMEEKIADELDLTEPQRAKLAAIKTEFLAHQKEFRQHRAEDSTQIIALLKSKSIEEAQVRALLDNKKASFDQAVDRILPKLIDLHASLTDEQKAKAAEKIEKIRKWHEED